MTHPIAAPRLRKEPRRAQILRELRLAPHVRVAELAGRFGVTTETIRRDIGALERAGLLQRSHGGASARGPGAYSPLGQRSRERVAERDRLAARAAALVGEGDSVMIDAGSTAMAMARALAAAEPRVTVITNSLQVAIILGASAAARVVLAPGAYRDDEAAVTGTETCDFLRRFHADACFLGAAGLEARGVTEAVEGFAAVKRVMMAQAARTRFLINSGKFGAVHLNHVSGLEGIGTLVTDAAPEGDLARALAAGGVEVLLPGTG